MGSQPSTPRGAGGPPTRHTGLLEEYSIGATLGEGSSSVVSSCRKHATSEEFAVKMLDKVETPYDVIKNEIELLWSLHHRNIVKLHGVFYERCFTCMIMDRYGGGDLVEGMQRHQRERGHINCHAVVHVAQQMAASVQYLHRRRVVHRDVKGDNYLVDRQDIADPGCLIVLTDFGTACRVGPDTRLSERVGTKMFWAPELLDKNYGMKVDVWAMGVIMYGIVTGRFPFSGEKDIRAKEVRIPKRVHPVCEDFIRKILEKSEAARPSADMVMLHQWVAGSGGERRARERADTRDWGVTLGGEAGTTPTNLREDLVNDGIKERRQELISRLNREHETRGAAEGEPRRAAASHFLARHFTLCDRNLPGAQLTYEWCDVERAKAAGVLDIKGRAQLASAAESREEGNLDLGLFSRMLEEHNIDPSRFGSGEAKLLEQLAGEVRGGAVQLMLDAQEHKKLVRVVDVVLLRLRSPGREEPQLLVETEERYPDGRTRAMIRLPGTKKEPHENTWETAQRILGDILHVRGDGVRLDLDAIHRFEDETESPSYPGVRTIYRKEIVEGMVCTQEADQLARLGLPGLTAWSAADARRNTKSFAWMSDRTAEARGVKLRAVGAEAVSTLVRPPIGLSEAELRVHLGCLGVDAGKFGRDSAKTIKQFSDELVRGEAALLQDPSGELIRVVDVVTLTIANPATGLVLIQGEQVLPDGRRCSLHRLPGAKRRPDENPFRSARRILRRLKIEENQVHFNREFHSTEEERSSPAYPGLRTIYRKHFIGAELVAPTLPAAEGRLQQGIQTQCPAPPQPLPHMLGRHCDGGKAALAAPAGLLGAGPGAAAASPGNAQRRGAHHLPVPLSGIVGEQDGN